MSDTNQAGLECFKVVISQNMLGTSIYYGGKDFREMCDMVLLPLLSYPCFYGVRSDEAFRCNQSSC